jgi:hypothetical protein
MQGLDFGAIVLLTFMALLPIGFVGLVIDVIVSSIANNKVEKEEMLAYGRKEAELYKEFTKGGVLIELVGGKKYVALLASESGYYKFSFNGNSINQVFNACAMDSIFRVLYEVPEWSTPKGILRGTRQIKKVDNVIINQDAVVTLTLLANNVEWLNYYYRRPKGYPSFKELLTELESLGE